MRPTFPINGICESTIIWGTQRYDCDDQGPRSEITFGVRSDQLCCFYRALFGRWDCLNGLLDVTSTPVAYESYPLPCNGGIAEPFALLFGSTYHFEPVRARVVPGRNTGPAGELDLTGSANDWQIRCPDGSAALVQVVVEYRMRRRQVPRDFYAEQDEVEDGPLVGGNPTAASGPEANPLTVDWPSHMTITKQSGVEFVKVRDNVRFCEVGPCANVPDVPMGPASGQGTLQTAGVAIPNASCNYCVTWSITGTDNGNVTSVRVTDGTGAATLVDGANAANGTVCFSAPVVPDVAVIAEFDGEASRTLNATLSAQADNICCGEAPDEAPGKKTVQTDRVTVNWLEVPCYNDSLMKNLRGAVNSEAFLGYPAYGLWYGGYDVRDRYNCMGNVVFDISTQFVAKTVPADGETGEYLDANGGFIAGHERISGMVGAWGRSYCQTPIAGTQQHWQFLCDGQGNPLFQATNLFFNMFQIPLVP